MIGRNARDVTELILQTVHEEQDPRVNPLGAFRNELPPPNNRIPFQLLDDGGRRSIWWGGHRIPLKSIDTHFVTVGTAGSGKTLLTNITVASVLDIIKAGDEDTLCILFETKAGYLKMLEAMGVEYELINIHDARSAGLELCRDIRDYAQAEQIGHVLVKSNPNDANPFWIKLTRAKVAGVTKTWVYLYLTYGIEYGLDDIYNVLVKDNDLLIEFLKLYPGNEGLINNVLTTSARTTLDNSKIDTQTELQPLYMAAAHCQKAKRKFSITKFINGELQHYQEEGAKPKRVLVIAQDLNAMESSRPFIQALFECIATQINALSDSKTRQIWVFLDEARFIGKLKSLHLLAVFGRSRGARLSLTLQALEGFYEEYGRNDANEILANCGFKTALKTLSPETAKYLSSLFGQTEFYEVVYNPSYSGQGVSVSHHKQRVKREKVLDSEFLGLPYPSPEEGLTGIFMSPFTDGFKETIPGDELNDLKPPFRNDIADLVPKSHDQQILDPVSNEELLELISAVRDGKLEKLADTSTPYEPTSDWEKLRAALYDETFEMIKAILSKNSEK